MYENINMSLTFGWLEKNNYGVKSMQRGLTTDLLT